MAAHSKDLYGGPGHRNIPLLEDWEEEPSPSVVSATKETTPTTSASASAAAPAAAAAAAAQNVPDIRYVLQYQNLNGRIIESEFRPLAFRTCYHIHTPHPSIQIHLIL